MKKKAAFLGLLIYFLSVTLHAQGYQLNGRSALGLNMGMFSGAKSSGIVAINGYNTNLQASGFAGGIFFNYWLQEDLSLKFSAGMLTGSANVNVNFMGSTQQASTVMPITIGMNYYFMKLFSNDAIRPFVSASAGMYVGSEAKNSILSQQVHSESAFGGRAGAGIDFIVGNHFILGANFGYNLMANFANPVGGNKNYNGADFLFQFEYVF